MGWDGKVYHGECGKAWLVDEFPGAPAWQVEASLATWVVEARWAHPIWFQYCVFVISLRDIPGAPPAKFHRPDATHDIYVEALDPEYPVPVSHVRSYDNPLRRLSPMNYGYQFTAESDEVAVNRARELVEQIADGLLNPDTDARPVWDRLFADSVSMVKSSPLSLGVVQ